MHGAAKRSVLVLGSALDAAPLAMCGAKEVQRTCVVAGRFNRQTADQPSRVVL